MHDSAQQINASVSDQPELAHLLARANADYEALSEEDVLRFSAFVADRVFSTYENAYYQRSRGFIDDGIWIVWEESFRDILTPAMVRYWTPVARYDFLQYPRLRRLAFQGQ